MAVDYLSAINKQGSGLNITQIVDSLVQAETTPISSRIQENIDKKTATSRLCINFSRAWQDEKFCDFSSRIFGVSDII